MIGEGKEEKGERERTNKKKEIELKSQHAKYNPKLNITIKKLKMRTDGVKEE